jgi:hypothetical protein
MHTGWTVFIGILFASGAAMAQDVRAAGASHSLIMGQVREAGTGRPIPGATISSTAAVLASTDDDGEFTIQLSAVGRVTLRVRRLGYDSVSVDIEVPAAPGTHFIFELHRVVGLDTMVISAPAMSGSPKLEGFERRLARHNGGTFFTRDDIERRHPLVASELVRRASGVRIVDSMGVRLFASARGAKVVDDRRGFRSVPCIMRVGVDGHVMEWGFAADQIPTNEIYGIEVYSGPATLPREYASQVTDGFCGLVMIWTR